MKDRGWVVKLTLFAAVALIALALATARARSIAVEGGAQKGESNTRTVNGQVVNKAGNPLRAVIYLKNTKTLQIRTYIADDGGNFHFQGLSTNIDYQVHAEHEGVSSSVKTIDSFDSRKQLHLLLKIPK